MKKSIMVGMFIAVFCLGVVACDQFKAQPTKWEYKILWGMRSTDAQLVPLAQGQLDKLGKDGWELVSVQADDVNGTTSTDVSLYLKRPLAQ